MNIGEKRDLIRAENEAMRAVQSVPPPTPRKLTAEEMASIGMPCDAPQPRGLWAAIREAFQWHFRFLR